MNFIFIVIFLLCFPLAFPSFYLAYKLASKGSLGNIFNQNIFLLFVITGKTWNMGLSLKGLFNPPLLCRILHSFFNQQPPLHQSGLSGGVAGGGEGSLQLRDHPEAPGGLLLVQQLQLHDSLQGGRNTYTTYIFYIDNLYIQFFI